MSTPKRKPGRPATGKTPIQNVRVPDRRWTAAERAAGAIGMNRSELVNALLAWFTREHGAKLPKRPEAPPPAADGEPEAAEQQPSSE